MSSLSDTTWLEISQMITGNTKIKTTGKCLPQALIWKDGEGEGETSVVRRTKNRQVKQGEKNYTGLKTQNKG